VVRHVTAAGMAGSGVGGSGGGVQCVSGDLLVILVAPGMFIFLTS